MLEEYVLSRIVTENISSIGTFLLDLRWPGFKPVSFESIGQRCIITLEPREKFARCPHCGQLCYKRHSCQTRVLRDARSLLMINLCYVSKHRATTAAAVIRVLRLLTLPNQEQR